ncbi:hypothetical protein L873DRAFT_1799585 [Choiromyces venosus 120613-1]|uniref:Uncharacterized protein n=1 Tax=Choiromyces venosus 120613-1 TaxID=1336337 RepID=A0A3N4K3P1_9PEZI|nr:hypothetical protein L873DRAFT_1799585 [Choiromyces venosus 120613-1]
MASKHSHAGRYSLIPYFTPPLQSPPSRSQSSRSPPTPQEEKTPSVGEEAEVTNPPPKILMETTDIHESMRQTIAMITDINLEDKKVIPYLRTLFEYHLYRSHKYGAMDKCLQFMHDQMAKLARKHELQANDLRTRLAQRLALDALLVAHMGHGDAAHMVLLRFSGRKAADNLVDWEMFELTRMRKKMARAGVNAAEDRLRAVLALCREKAEYAAPGLWAAELVKAKVEDQMGKFRVLEADKRLRLRVFGPTSKPWGKEGKPWTKETKKNYLDMAEKALGAQSSSCSSSSSYSSSSAPPPPPPPKS